ncbi:MAG: nuclease domain-containing protein [Corticimicrobacter sp.]|uniref:nuclease domain-containing protein n=1 Tax=Corticimicrobacter sp. TaxID=2678536 RepID=UPI0032D9BAB9
MLKACKGQSCYLKVPGVCLGAAGNDTVVPCHSNQQAHGKGMGLKAPDQFTVPGCRACHAWLDQGPADRETKFKTWNEAYSRWVEVRDGEVV